jgi:hypothetical protein
MIGQPALNYYHEMRAQAYTLYNNVISRPLCFPDEDDSLHPSNTDLLACPVRLEFCTSLLCHGLRATKIKKL